MIPATLPPPANPDTARSSEPTDVDDPGFAAAFDCAIAAQERETTTEDELPEESAEGAEGQAAAPTIPTEAVVAVGHAVVVAATLEDPAALAVDVRSEAVDVPSAEAVVEPAVEGPTDEAITDPSAIVRDQPSPEAAEDPRPAPSVDRPAEVADELGATAPAEPTEPDPVPADEATGRPAVEVDGADDGASTGEGDPESPAPIPTSDANEPDAPAEVRAEPVDRTPGRTPNPTSTGTMPETSEDGVAEPTPPTTTPSNATTAATTSEAPDAGPAPASPPTTAVPVAPTTPTEPAPPTATAPASPPPSGAPEAPPVAEQLVGRVSSLLSGPDGTHELSIELRPAELGTVRLHVTLDDGVVSVRLHADDPASRQLLAGSLDDLRQQLSRAGIRTGALDVSTADPGTTGHRPGSDAGRDRTPRRDTSTPGTTTPVPGTTATAARLGGARTSLDLLL